MRVEKQISRAQSQPVHAVPQLPHPAQPKQSPAAGPKIVRADKSRRQIATAAESVGENGRTADQQECPVPQEGKRTRRGQADRKGRGSKPGGYGRQSREKGRGVR